MKNLWRESAPPSFLLLLVKTLNPFVFFVSIRDIFWSHVAFPSAVTVSEQAQRDKQTPLHLGDRKEGECVQRPKKEKAQCPPPPGPLSLHNSIYRFATSPELILAIPFRPSPFGRCFRPSLRHEETSSAVACLQPPFPLFCPWPCMATHCVPTIAPNEIVVINLQSFEPRLILFIRKISLWPIFCPKLFFPVPFLCFHKTFYFSFSFKTKIRVQISNFDFKFNLVSDF